jgi:hypothetical protein
LAFCPGGQSDRMKKLMIALAAAAFIAPAANAQTKVASGDTCTYSGSGASYTVSIAVGSGVQQYGVAVGAPGITVTNVSISGENGNYASTNLPPKTTGAWISDTPLTGNLAATLAVSGTPTGKFVIVPAASQSSYLSPVTCSLKTSPVKATIDIKVRAPKYSVSAHAWHLMVSVPVAGTLSAVQPLSTNITPVLLDKQKALVQTHAIGTKTGGLITLTLRPTSSGSTMLASKHVIKVNLRVTFDATSGLSTHKTVSLMLRK